MADEIYNSSFTGAQIDEAVSDVRTNKEKWNNAATKADQNATDIKNLETSLGEDIQAVDEKIDQNATNISNLGGTVSEHTTDIEALQLGVQTNQTAIGNLGSAISANTTAIGQKASQADLNVLSTSTSQQIQSVQATANEAKTAATNAQTTADSKAPMYTYGTSDLTAGSSSLATGTLYFVYE